MLLSSFPEAEWIAFLLLINLMTVDSISPYYQAVLHNCTPKCWINIPLQPHPLAEWKSPNSSSFITEHYSSTEQGCWLQITALKAVWPAWSQRSVQLEYFIVLKSPLLAAELLEVFLTGSRSAQCHQPLPQHCAYGNSEASSWCHTKKMDFNPARPVVLCLLARAFRGYSKHSTGAAPSPLLSQPLVTPQGKHLKLQRDLIKPICTACLFGKGISRFLSKLALWSVIRRKHVPV